MDELNDLLRGLQQGNLGGDAVPTQVTQMPNQIKDMLGISNYSPSLHTKLLLYLILLLFVSISLVKAGASLIRSIGIVLLFISLIAIMLLILYT